LLKEREQEDKEFGDTPKFLTSSYKKKLVEDRKWEITEKLEERYEERNDATKVGMAGFYSSLLTKNVAMGGDLSAARSAYTVGSKRSDLLLGQAHSEPATQSTSPGAVGEEDEQQALENQPKRPRAQSPTPADAEASKMEAEEAPLVQEKAKSLKEVPPPPGEDAIAAAKERYLQRKRQKGATPASKS
jgi:coiled-coil domain-containing protein 55